MPDLQEQIRRNIQALDAVDVRIQELTVELDAEEAEAGRLIAKGNKLLEQRRTELTARRESADA